MPLTKVCCGFLGCWEWVASEQKISYRYGLVPSTQLALEGAWKVIRSIISISFVIQCLWELDYAKLAGIKVFVELVNLWMMDLTRAM